MPELPEVEIMTRNIHRWSAGKELVHFEGREFPLSWKTKRFGEAYRRGKFVVWPIGDLFFLLHFRMTGKVVLEDEPRKYIRFRWILGDGTTLCFIDQRRFGTVELLSKSDLELRFQNLGEEPWPQIRDGRWYQKRLGGCKGALKTTMLQQDRIAGIGNIMASEICFRMRIDPRSSCRKLILSDWAKYPFATEIFHCKVPA